MSQSIKLGLALGLTTMGRWRGEASMYLYPSLVLPVLPEWDREKYPYACIVDSADNSGTRYVTLYVFTEPYTIDVESDDYAYSTVLKPLCEFSCDIENANWGELTNWDDSHPDNAGVRCSVGDVVWTNFDWTVGWVSPYQTITKYRVGDVVMAAFTPVPAGNGMAAYQGVRLPKLPEWDKGAYPYAVIVGFDSIPYRLYVGNNEFGVDSYGLTSTTKSPGTDGVFYEYDVTTNAWAKKGTFSLYLAFSAIPGDLVWCNSNIRYTKDGRLALEASEPVPIYE